MKLLRQLGIVLTISIIGEMLSKYIIRIIPGNVMGMIILLLLLSFKVIKVEMIDDISSFLLKYLAFFFIPAGVGLISNLELLRGKWIPIIFICIISTALVMITTGITIQFLKGRLKT